MMQKYWRKNELIELKVSAHVKTRIFSPIVFGEKILLEDFGHQNSFRLVSSGLSSLIFSVLKEIIKPSLFTILTVPLSLTY